MLLHLRPPKKTCPACKETVRACSCTGLSEKQGGWKQVGMVPSCKVCGRAAHFICFDCWQEQESDRKFMKVMTKLGFKTIGSPQEQDECWKCSRCNKAINYGEKCCTSCTKQLDKTQHKQIKMSTKQCNSKRGMDKHRYTRY